MEIIFTPDDLRRNADRHDPGPDSFYVLSREIIYRANKVTYIDAENRFHKVLKSRDGDL